MQVGQANISIFNEFLALRSVFGNCYTVISSSRVAAEFLLTPGIGPPRATRYKHSWSSVNRVCDSKAQRYAEDNRTESNCARRFVLLKLSTDRHKASCCLFATTELLVCTSVSAGFVLVCSSRFICDLHNYNLWTLCVTPDLFLIHVFLHVSPPSSFLSLSPTITLLFHSRLKTHVFHESLPRT